MIRVNLIGQYEGPYTMSGGEKLLILANLILLAGLAAYLAGL
jgi:hypothetical protein